MEKKEHITSNPRGVCEKLFDALSITPAYQSLRRISYHSHDPVPPVVPNQSPLSHTDEHVKTSGGVQNQLPIPGKPDPIKGTHITGLPVPVKRKVAEVVPIKVDTLLPPPPPPLSTTIEKEKQKTPSVSAKTKVSGKIDVAAATSASEHGQGKHKNKVTSIPVKEVIKQGKENGGKVDLLNGAKDKEKIVVSPETAPIQEENRRKGSLANINEKASDYIARAKVKIRSSTMVGGGGGAGAGGRATS